jgi:hypothetical protein
MENEIHHRSFAYLLSDAIFFERLARNETDDLKRKRYVRSSIMSTFLTLECAANCCIFCLRANKQLIGGIDRLPFLSKFDLFSLLGFDKKLDYGRNEVQKVKEVKQIRDSIVHPKVIKTEIGKHIEGERSFSCFPHNVTFSSKPKPSTDLVSNSSLWSHEDCISALQSVVDFFNYLFIELLDMEKGLIFSLLNDAVILDGKPAYSIYPPSLFEELEYLKSVGINVQFMITEP